MIDIQEAILESIVVHQVGNKSQEDHLVISRKELELHDDVKDILKNYFLKSVKEEGYYQFTHETGLEFNEVYNFCKSIFDQPSDLYEQSINLAKHLFEASTHPNIKGGDFYVTYLSGFKYNDEHVNAIGMFKSENKDTFIKVFQKGADLAVDCDVGVNINKLDKGCLILQTEEEGYRVIVVDHTNRTSETARYWRHDFLQLAPMDEKYHHTDNYMDVCKGFVEEVFNDDFDIPKTDQLRMLDNSINYFAKNSQFDKESFQREVIPDDELFEAFESYKTNFSEVNDVQLYDEFDISKPAVKNQKKFFKSVIKLDKKFHVYVHGGHDFMEQGFDDKKQMKFYKLYYHQEL